MGQALGRLPIGRIDKATTCNLGIINGGNATNIVPEECIVNGEARSLNPKRLEEFIQGARPQLQKREDRPSREPTKSKLQIMDKSFN